VIDEGDITPDDILRTGLSTAELRWSIAGAGTLLRIELRLVGDDKRVALRERIPSPDQIDAVVVRLRRFDTGAGVAWTGRYLQLIASQPGIVSRALAPQVECEVPTFKRRIRQLKELGLTESLEVGYRLSPRGEQVLRHIDPQSSRGPAAQGAGDAAGAAADVRE